MEGGPSHLDLFDPKPLLNKLAGQSLPESFGTVLTSMGESRSPLLASKRTWRQHGQSGIWVSDWLPQIAECADDLAVVRSCWMDGINHSAGVCQMNTGSILGGRPSLGSWATYGLGTVNTDLPAFVVLQDNQASIVNGPRNWSAGFMPAVYQGTRLQGGSEPIPNLNTPEQHTPEQQQTRLAFINSLNRNYAARFPDQTELAARLTSYELAYRMQASAPSAVDLAEETAATRSLYGLDRKETADMGRLCLLSRRLVERGVRFVQIYHGAGSKWDSHSGMEKNHGALCASMDQPVAALLRDLKARGMLHDTLVVWGGEFGRTPFIQGNLNDRPRWGRDHHPYGFTIWMAGAGVKPGMSYGETDDLGMNAVRDPVHVHDLQATLLHLMGFDHKRLTYRFQGRDFRLTDVHGELVKGVMT